MKKSLSKYLFITGVLIFIISYLLPVDFFENFTNLRPQVLPVYLFVGL